jgi:multidrug resistance efflux pump
VKKGQFLIQIDPAQYLSIGEPARGPVSQMEASLAQARPTATRPSARPTAR